MNELVIYGASYPDIVKLVDAINRKRNAWKIVGFLDDLKKDKIDSFMGFRILGGEESIKHYHEQGCYFVNNVFGTTRNRALVTDKLDGFQANYATLISPDVDTNYVRIGYGCTIMEGVKLGANTVIGNHVGIRLNSSINHDSVIEHNVFIGPGVTICSHVRIREGAYIGAGSVIKQNLTIHRWSTVGMGANVHRDVQEGDIVAVAPARSVKKLVISQ